MYCKEIKKEKNSSVLWRYDNTLVAPAAVTQRQQAVRCTKEAAEAGVTHVNKQTNRQINIQLGMTVITK